MKINFSLFLILVLFGGLGCSKEVQIDIPSFEQQLVVDGRIETNGFPLVILSMSQNLYEPTTLSTYITSNVQDAIVYVSNGTDSVQLQLFDPASLPIESKATLAEMLGIELDELVFFPIKVYSTTQSNMKGISGKSYTLSIAHQSNTYTSTTTLMNPVALSSIQWIPDVDNANFGICRTILNDPAAQKNAYRWETKRVSSFNGQPNDNRYRHNPGAFFSDQFFNGLSITFDTKYPEKDTTYPSGYRKHYKLGDSVSIKFSSIETAVFDYFDKRLTQMQNASSPFSTPINIPSNVKPNALGVWAGFSTWYDTLYCIP
jgi:hypothetical protein